MKKKSFGYDARRKEIAIQRCCKHDAFPFFSHCLSLFPFFPIRKIGVVSKQKQKKRGRVHVHLLSSNWKIKTNEEHQKKKGDRVQAVLNTLPTLSSAFRATANINSSPPTASSSPRWLRSPKLFFWSFAEAEPKKKKQATLTRKNNIGDASGPIQFFFSVVAFAFVIPCRYFSAPFVLHPPIPLHQFLSFVFLQSIRPGRVAAA